jgi:hypothetical protein
LRRPTAEEAAAAPTADDLPLLGACGALIVDIAPSEQRGRDGELAGCGRRGPQRPRMAARRHAPHCIPETGDASRETIVVCKRAQSSLAAPSLQRLGLRNATDLGGGFQAVLA